MSSFDPAPESSRTPEPSQAPGSSRTPETSTARASARTPEPETTGAHAAEPTVTEPHRTDDGEPAPATARVGTIVWGLVVLALAVLIIISQLGIVALNGTYVVIGLMLGAGAALVIGGLLSARRRDNSPTTGKS